MLREDGTIGFKIVALYSNFLTTFKVSQGRAAMLSKVLFSYHLQNYHWYQLDTVNTLCIKIFKDLQLAIGKGCLGVIFLMALIV